MSKSKSKHANGGKRWTVQHDAKLVDLVLEGEAVGVVSVECGRSMLALCCRLHTSIIFRVSKDHRAKVENWLVKLDNKIYDFNFIERMKKKALLQKYCSNKY